VKAARHRLSASLRRRTVSGRLAAQEQRGNGQFKPSSLRNVAVRPPYMHDGRFSTLEQAVDFYATGVKNGPVLSRMHDTGANAVHANFTGAQRERDDPRREP
jgi:cytochrome c peroxidase